MLYQRVNRTVQQKIEQSGMDKNPLYKSAKPGLKLVRVIQSRYRDNDLLEVVTLKTMTGHWPPRLIVEEYPKEIYTLSRYRSSEDATADLHTSYSSDRKFLRLMAKGETVESVTLARQLENQRQKNAEQAKRDAAEKERNRIEQTALADNPDALMVDLPFITPGKISDEIEIKTHAGNYYHLRVAFNPCEILDLDQGCRVNGFKWEAAGFHTDMKDGHISACHDGGNAAADYGEAEGLSDLPAGDFNQVVSSPPYVDSMERKGGIDPLKSNHVGGPHSQMNRSDTRYGASDGQLGSAPVGDFEQVVSSPPYEGSRISAEGGSNANDMRRRTHSGKYGSVNLDQVGAMNGDTFWSASKLIVEQCYLALAPNGHACWVVKDYVRGGQRIPFCDMWRQLCESVGFVTLHEHHAWVVEDNGTQAAFDGNDKSHKKSRKSFFRRLAESKGSPEINWETVYCMVRPG